MATANSLGALGGGFWTVQNKILPGSYINFISVPKPSNIFGERGYSAIALEMDWGVEEKIFSVEPAELQQGALELFGYSYTDEKLRPIREIMKYSKMVYFYRLNHGGDKATATIGGLTATAKYSGEVGNNLQVAIKANMDNEGYFEVVTHLGDNKVDSQIVQSIEELENNKFVDFTGSGELEQNVGTALQGGTNKEVTGEAHSNFLELLENEYFNVVGYAGNDEPTKQLYEAFIKRLRDIEGVKAQAVLFDRKANHEGIINLKSKAEGDDSALVPWVTGAEAGCEINRSITNMLYDGEYTVSTDYRKSELKESIKNGEFMFYKAGDEVRVLSDINSFTEFSLYKNQDFAFNQVIRVLDEVAMSCAKIFNKRYLGKAQNNENDRISLWADFVAHARTMQQIGAIQNFEAEDIIVEQGLEKDAVYSAYNIQPVVAMQKLYMNVYVA